MALWQTSIRVRLTFWYSLLVLSTLLLFGGITYYFTGRTLSENLDISLMNDVRWVREFIGPQARRVKSGRRSVDTILKQSTPVPVPPDSARVDSLDEATNEIWYQIYRHTLQSRKKTYIQFSDRRGTLLYRSFNLGTDTMSVRDSIPLSSTIVVTGSIHAQPVRIAAFRDENFTYLVGYPLDDLRDLLDNLYLIFIIMIPVALIVSAVGGYILAKNSLRPVEEISTRARKITAENLDQTVPVPHVRDEIGRLAETINDMIRRLHDSFAQVKQFSADASHELRTPLTIVRGELELALRSPKTPDQYRSILESTLEEIMRMNAIIENLLVLAKADQGTFRAEFSEVDLHALIEELYEDSELLAGRKRISVTLAKNTPVTIVGDRVRLRQLLLNLIDNAIKYTPEGGSVILAVDRRDGTAVIEVTDTGIGIPPEELPKIFDRFYRVDKARSRAMGGSGLGLSIAKWIAELHRGRIEVSSDLQQGSTFSVHLPIT